MNYFHIYLLWSATCILAADMLTVFLVKAQNLIWHYLISLNARVLSFCAVVELEI